MLSAVLSLALLASAPDAPTATDATGGHDAPTTHDAPTPSDAAATPDAPKAQEAAPSPGEPSLVVLHHDLLLGRARAWLQDRATNRRSLLLMRGSELALGASLLAVTWSPALSWPDPFKIVLSIGCVLTMGEAIYWLGHTLYWAYRDPTPEMIVESGTIRCTWQEWLTLNRNAARESREHREQWAWIGALTGVALTLLEGRLMTKSPPAGKPPLWFALSSSTLFFGFNLYRALDARDHPTRVEELLAAAP